MIFFLGDILKDAEGKDDDPTLFRVVLTPSCDLVRTDGRESSEGKDDDPASFRVVLTPSCDLERAGDRKPKVSQVLVAKCCSMKNGLRSYESEKHYGDSRTEGSSVVACYPYIRDTLEAVIPFPGLRGKNSDNGGQPARIGTH